MNPFDVFDVIYYINLDKRTDRKQQLLEEFNNMNINMNKVKRIPGVIDSIPCLGCSKAHLNALLDCKKNNYKNCLIIEDDFMFKLNKDDTYKQLQMFWLTEQSWDVLMLSGNILKYEIIENTNISKVLNAQTTSGYAVNSSYLPILIKNYQDGINKLCKLKKRQNKFCIDIYWKHLQPSANWFVFHPTIGKQRAGYSDIECKQTNYNK